MGVTIQMVLINGLNIKQLDPHYIDIKGEELKCRADRNREWKYDAVKNLWKCKMIDWNQ